MHSTQPKDLLVAVILGKSIERADQWARQSLPTGSILPLNIHVDTIDGFHEIEYRYHSMFELHHQAIRDSTYTLLGCILVDILSGNWFIHHSDSLIRI